MNKYKIFESITDSISDIRNCFLPISDITKVNIKRNISSIIDLSISLDHLVSSTKVSKFGVNYSPVKDGDEIADLIADAIDHCKLLNIEIYFAQVSWKNAGEWMVSGKEGFGPGILNKTFMKGGKIDNFDNPVKGRYDIDILSDFVSSKGDLLRGVKITFKLNNL